MKKHMMWCALTLAALFLSGCGSNITSGLILEKEYDDPDSWIYMQPQYTTVCTTVNNVTSCRQQLVGYTSIPMHDGPHWKLHIQNNGQRRWLEVPQTDYDNYRVGAWYGEDRV